MAAFELQQGQAGAWHSLVVDARRAANAHAADLNLPRDWQAFVQRLEAKEPILHFEIAHLNRSETLRLIADCNFQPAPSIAPGFKEPETFWQKVALELRYLIGVALIVAMWYLVLLVAATETPLWAQ